VLAVVATWLLHPFFTARQIGSGDARWYANMLADFVTQWRAGVFPVFVGQTEFAFNGAVYPLRVAPLYQHFGGVLDFLTGHRLGWIALQHLCVVVAGVAGIFSCYFALCSVAQTVAPSDGGKVEPLDRPTVRPSDRPIAPPSDRSVQRWTAVALATLYLSCPGLLGTIYTQDLYMTWMTVPFAPLAVYAIVRTFQRDDFIAQLWLAGSLAALWLAHAPIALWFTLIAFVTQCIRLVVVHRTPVAWKRAAFGAAALIVLGGYPFLSVSMLHSPGAPSVINSELSQPERITQIVREVFPAVLEPLSEHARALSDLQLGYGLWLILGATLAAAFWTPRIELRLLLAACAVLLTLLLPIPGITDWLWQHLPEGIKRVTFYWPMQRFYLVLAALLAFSGQLALETWTQRRPLPRIVLATLLGAACAWSLWESRQFIAAGSDRTKTAFETERAERPENLAITTHAYGLFSALPGYFSNGFMDPRSELRLLDRDTLAPLPPPSARVIQEGTLEGEPDGSLNLVILRPAFHLAPGRHYELSFGWAERIYTGVLQLAGRQFFREYALPASGERLAFGVGVDHATVLPLWSTASDGDDVTLRFIPTTTDITTVNIGPFAHFTLTEIDPSTRPVELISLFPFKATVRSTAAAWLETPRMFMPGYRATVDRLPVEPRCSPQGLTMLPIPAGNHDVGLVLEPPSVLRAAYWITLAAWLTVAASAAANIISKRSPVTRRQPADS